MTEQGEKVRTEAYHWHSGQWSELYRFASSGIIEDRGLLILDVESIIDWIRSKPRGATSIERNVRETQVADLKEIVDYVNDLPKHPTLEGAHVAPWANLQPSKQSV